MARGESRPQTEYHGAGACAPVLCPLCGTTTRRIPRRPL